MDASVIAISNAGSSGAADIETVFVTQFQPLRRWLTGRTRDADAAEDIAQEAFARLVREIRAGRAPDDPAAWLHRVALNLATSRGRRLTVADRNADRLPLPQSVPGPEAWAVDDEVRGLLTGALAELPDADREAVVLAARGHRGPEIARHLGRSDGATRTLLCRARARLRVHLLAGGYEPG